MIIYQCEDMLDVLDEIMPLHQKHWEELRDLRPDGEFSPDYSRFMTLEASSQARLMTARSGSELIGYSQFYLNRHPYVKQCFAQLDITFVLRPWRGQWIAVKLIKMAHEEARKLGATRMRAPVNEKNPIITILKYLGYADQKITHYERKL